MRPSIRPSLIIRKSENIKTKVHRPLNKLRSGCIKIAGQVCKLKVDHAIFSCLKGCVALQHPGIPAGSVYFQVPYHEDTASASTYKCSIELKRSGTGMMIISATPEATAPSSSAQGLPCTRLAELHESSRSMAGFCTIKAANQPPQAR